MGVRVPPRACFWAMRVAPGRVACPLAVRNRVYAGEGQGRAGGRQEVRGLEGFQAVVVVVVLCVSGGALAHGTTPVLRYRAPNVEVPEMFAALKIVDDKRMGRAEHRGIDRRFERFAVFSAAS